MAKLTKRQQAYAILSYFQKVYKKSHGVDLRVNKYTGYWGVETLLEDLSKEEVYELIDYYFDLDRVHSTGDLFANYTKIITEKANYEKILEERRLLREQTKKIVEDYKANNIE